MTMDEILAEVKRAGSVTGEDVLAVRRALYGPGIEIPQAQVEKLFAVDQAVREADPSWEKLLSEAAVDYLVNQAEPEGYLDEAKAGWLVDQTSAGGMVRTPTALEAFVRVLEEARSSPAMLTLFALRQVRAAVVDGKGPLGGIASFDAGRVTADQTSLLRRILYASGGQANGAISREEADIIFDINDASVRADNDPAWNDLFVKSVANCIMSASGYIAPPRHVALAEEKGLGEAEEGVSGIIADMAVSGLRGILDAYREPMQAADWARGKPAPKTGDDDEAFSQDDAAWLAERINRNGELDANEKALLRFLRDEAPVIHPTLRQLIAKSA